MYRLNTYLLIMLRFEVLYVEGENYYLCVAGISCGVDATSWLSPVYLVEKASCVPFAKVSQFVKKRVLEPFEP